MSVKHTLLDFKVPPDRASLRDEIRRRIETVLSPLLGTADLVFSTCSNGKPTGSIDMFVGKGTSNNQWTVRTFPDGLVTLDIVEYPIANRQSGINIGEMEELKSALHESLSADSAHLIPTITRGDNKAICNYFDTSDGRLKEYDFDRIVYQSQSKYQDILIVHSNQFGNMLFLDMQEMIAESDVAYTKALLGNGQENYKDKTVLILGGGDGGVLHEVLKESPKFVTMVEIDKAVIDSSVKYLRGVCGSSMDSLTGHNYKILIDDCVKVLHEFIAEGRTFDFVINDLTDAPISTEPQESLWDFIQEILQLSLKVLSRDGKYYNQSTGVNSKDALAKYEQQFDKLDCPVEFKQFTAFVPSFMELWVFYKIWKTPS